jgi:hypothetical protein
VGELEVADRLTSVPPLPYGVATRARESPGAVSDTARQRSRWGFLVL